MGSLSNLYISQSYQSLLHFGTDTSASATLIEVEDGVGNGLGLYLNTIGNASLDGDLTVGGDFIVSGTFDIEGKVTVNDNVRVNGNLEVSGATSLTGSLVVLNDITSSNAFIQNDLNVGGTLFASKVVTLIESSSIIFSSGSNILGDETSDIQTLIGLVRMSGSSQLTGSSGITGDLNVLGNISSSTISGIGNVTLYSQSVDNRLDIVEATASLYVPFSQSVDSRLDFLEGPFSSSVSSQIISLQAFTASVGLVTTQSFQQFTASTNARLNSIEIATSSLQIFSASAKIQLSNLELTTASLNSSITQLNLFTSSNGNTSLNAYTQSNDTKWNTLQTTTSSLNTFTASQNNLNVTFATTGSNTFVGSNTFNKSVNGVVNALSITSNTASMDCSLGNFFTLTLVANTPTRLIPTNVQSGETISLKITQPATTGSLTYNSSTIKFPAGLQYTASISPNAVDILTFVTYDASTLFSVAVKSMS